VDILLVKRDGRFSGEAYCVLSSPAMIQAALDKNKSYMGRRYVEVFKAKKLVRGSRRCRRLSVAVCGQRSCAVSLHA
jgi:hypothetical protein